MPQIKNKRPFIFINGYVQAGQPSEKNDKIRGMINITITDNSPVYIPNEYYEKEHENVLEIVGAGYRKPCYVSLSPATFSGFNYLLSGAVYFRKSFQVMNMGDRILITETRERSPHFQEDFEVLDTEKYKKFLERTLKVGISFLLAFAAIEQDINRRDRTITISEEEEKKLADFAIKFGNSTSKSNNENTEKTIHALPFFTMGMNDYPNETSLELRLFYEVYRHIPSLKNELQQEYRNLLRANNKKVMSLYRDFFEKCYQYEISKRIKTRTDNHQIHRKILEDFLRQNFLDTHLDTIIKKAFLAKVGFYVKDSDDPLLHYFKPTEKQKYPFRRVETVSFPVELSTTPDKLMEIAKEVKNLEFNTVIDMLPYSWNLGTMYETRVELPDEELFGSKFLMISQRKLMFEMFCEKIGDAVRQHNTERTKVLNSEASMETSSYNNIEDTVETEDFAPEL